MNATATQFIARHSWRGRSYGRNGLPWPLWPRLTPQENTMLRRAALLLIAAGLAVTMTAGTALASTGPAYYSRDQAGYVATGARFKQVEINAWLPDASRFSQQIGRLGFSLQMRTPALVIDLSVYACTDTTCQPGGSPVTRSYRLAFKVYNRSTHAVICSTAALTCPQVPSSWNSARFAPGHRIGLVLIYRPQLGYMDVEAGNQSYLNYAPSTGLDVNQVRIGVELGGTPWTTVPVHAPSAETRLASLGVPTPPPYWAEIVTYSGHASCLDSWWMRHKLDMTSDGTSGTPIEARPGDLSNYGCNFGVYLEP